MIYLQTFLISLSFVCFIINELFFLSVYYFLIKRLLMSLSNRQLIFSPPFCPNSQCVHHRFGEPEFAKKNGISKTAKAPQFNQRFLCRTCGTQFSQNTFSFDFRKKLIRLSRNILHFSLNGMSHSSIARELRVSKGSVNLRVKNLSHQSRLFEKENKVEKINENVAYDGFETFTYSQYSPCYINTAVGMSSHFVYHNTFSPLNRKGRMTKLQKIKQEKLLQKFGAYPKDSVYVESQYIFRAINDKAEKSIQLFSDEHQSYRRAFSQSLNKISHETISSRQRRNSRNPLFAINHLHLLYRHFLCSQKRETIAFQKHEAAMLEKVQLMKIYRNFLQPKFTKKNKFDEFAHLWSPAMYLKIVDRLLDFEDVFGKRRLRSHYNLDGRENDFLDRHYPFSRQKMAN
jgi:transposase-like protein